MAVTIPGQCCNAVAKREVHLVQRVGHFARAPCDVAVSTPVNVALDPAGHDFTFVVVSIRKLNQRRNKQLLTLHQPEHKDPLKTTKNGESSPTSAHITPWA